MYEHFVAICVGENPGLIMSKYDKSNKVEPYVLFKFSEANKIRKRYIDICKTVLSTEGISDLVKEDYQTRLEYYQDEDNDDVDVYLDITDGYTIDEETGDAVTCENPNGRYTSCCVGKLFSYPLIKTNGETAFSCTKGEVDWEKVHLNNKDLYDFTWESVVNNKVPETKEEKKAYNNMKNHKQYLLSFGDKDTYVLSNTAFWGTAFVTEKEWIQLGDDPCIQQFEWVINFYDRFIKNLSDDTLITIYECIR